MVMPVCQPDEQESQRTELQSRKMAFVQGLLARGTRPAEERAMRAGENRLTTRKVRHTQSQFTHPIPRLGRWV